MYQLVIVFDEAGALTVQTNAPTSLDRELLTLISMANSAQGMLMQQFCSMQADTLIGMPQALQHTWAQAISKANTKGGAR